MFFCDTSTLAKFYIQEAHSDAVKAKLSGPSSVMLLQLARVELMSVFHRRLREKQWDRTLFSEVIHQFLRDDLSGQWNWIPIDERIIEGASRVYLSLGQEIFLRASDCLHLVAALRWGAEEIYTHDERQAKAAEALGLKAVTID